MNQIIRKIKIVLKPLYKMSIYVVNNILDYYDYFTGNKNPLIPPRNMIFIGDGNYKKTGEEFFIYFKEWGNLKPYHKVLDIGCGIGRMSVPLTSYLTNEGEYYGFDIVKTGIEWCNENISSFYPNFHFLHSNIYNKVYNPNGIETSSDYTFKFNENFFDFVFVTSVFTHMYSKDVNRYLKEISRVIKKGGKCLITFFLLNEESISLINNGKSTQNLIYEIDKNSFARIKEIPESSIGYNEIFIRELFEAYSLKIIKIHFGSWCGRSKYNSYQDIIVAEKI